MEKILLITGGSRGIGAATALAAAKSGYVVALTYVSAEDRAAKVVGAIRDEGGRALAIHGDVAIEKDVERIFSTVDAELGPIFGLVNSAGIAGPQSPLSALKTEDLWQVFGVNVVGTFLCCREASQRMSTARGGRGGVIVNVSSAASRLGAPGVGVHYAATKGAVDTLTFGLAQELGKEGIRVNAVSPGVIDTEMQPPGRVAAMTPILPMGRVGKAEEVANAIVWLLGSDASYVSGAVLNVSGAR